MSSLFYLSSSYAVNIHEAIKKLLLHCPTQHLTWYGDIYYDAWKHATLLFVEVSVGTTEHTQITCFVYVMSCHAYTQQCTCHVMCT